jgi:Zn-dependent M28 family amino/carboxypeptidase
MHRAKAMIALLLCAFSGAAAEFSGKQAYEFTRRIVALGPRPPGSPGMRKAQAYLLAELKQRRCEIIQDDFVAQTPNGPIRMKNIIAKFGGNSGRAVVISGHYDTKLMPGIHFVGASDGGSSAGFLLEMARALDRKQRKDDIVLVWFDGEEAFGPWSDRDGLYGSRHLAKRWSADGTASRIKALINVDMIGDRQLQILFEHNSTPWLRSLLWETGRRLGYGRYFTDLAGAIEDDHVPFLRAGVPAVNLIHNYGGAGSYWHTPEDTMDKLAPESFEAVGAVVLAAIERLEGKP